MTIAAMNLGGIRVVLTASENRGSAARLRGWRRLRPGVAFDKILNRIVAAGFLLLAISTAGELVGRIVLAERTPLDLLAAADLAARACLALFFFLAGWLALARPQPVARATGLQPRIAAATAFALLFVLGFLDRRSDAPAWLLILSAVMILLGNGLSVLVLNRLGKSFSIMAEARHLVTDGPYRLVRHPLYVVEEIAVIGCFLPFYSVESLILYIAHIGIQALRIGNEEAVLRQAFPEYADYARRTARFIPGIW